MTGRPTILVVDDEPLALVIAMEVIDGLGFSVVQAPNADEALAILESRDDIRAVFTDVNMPGSMNGVELARTVSRRWPPVKILFASGGALESPHLLPPGVGYLTKPYSATAVEHTLREVFA